MVSFFNASNTERLIAYTERLIIVFRILEAYYEFASEKQRSEERFMKTGYENMLMLQKLSNREDFDKIYDKYFYRQELGIIRSNIDQNYSHNIWMNINCHKAENVNELYMSLVSDIYEEIVNMISHKDGLLNKENLLITIRNYMLGSIAEISNRLFITEISNAEMEEKIYIQKLADDYKNFEELAN